MAKRVITAPNVTTSVTRASSQPSKPRKPNGPANATGYASLIQSLYVQAAELMTALQDDQLDLSKRAIALNTIAKSLPLIRAAEEAASSHIRAQDKPIAALSDAELRELAKGAQDPIPHTESADGAVVPPLVKKAENQSEENLTDPAELENKNGEG